MTWAWSCLPCDSDLKWVQAKRREPMGCKRRWEEAAWCCIWKKVLNALVKWPWVTKSLRDAMRTPTIDASLQKMGFWSGCWGACFHDFGMHFWRRDKKRCLGTIEEYAINKSKAQNLKHPKTVVVLGFPHFNNFPLSLPSPFYYFICHSQNRDCEAYVKKSLFSNTTLVFLFPSPLRKNHSIYPASLSYSNIYARPEKKLHEQNRILRIFMLPCSSSSRC